MTRFRILVAAACLACTCSLDSAWGQLSQDDQAAALLAGARNAYNEGEFAFAAQRFQEFLQKYAAHPEAASARFGWGLAALHATPRDENKAIEVLTQSAAAKDFADQARAQYYLGLAVRSLGHKSLDQFKLKPAEPQHRDVAKQHFTRAAQLLAEAVKTLDSKITAPAAEGGKRPSEELEWSLRARCDLAEMQLQIGQVKEALATTEMFVKDPLAQASRWAGLGLYYHGYAAYLNKDYSTAVQTLSTLTPFRDPAYGVHARYLLARVHHLSGDREEAAGHYADLQADYDKQVAAAKEAIKNPAAFKTNPEELARLDALTKMPPPDYVARAGFFQALLAAENGKFTEARDKFAAFDKTFPQSALSVEAKLRLGIVLIQNRQHPEGIAVLTPLQDHAQYSDQARWWLGKAQIAAVDPMNVDLRKQQFAAAAAALKVAADRANALIAKEPEAKIRRSDILLEVADAQQQAGQLNEAAETLRTIINEGPQPLRAEEALQRLATVLHLNNKFAESQDHCQRFIQQFPRSILLPAVLFRSAENAFAEAEAVYKNPQAANRDAELAKWYDEAEKRYLDLLAKAPEFPQHAVARYGVAVCKYRRGKYAEAAKAFSEIPAGDRSGPLAASNYLAADCLMRLAPESADDAITAGRLLQEFGEAAKQLESFVGSNATHPLLPEALVKLGQCYAKSASVITAPPERNVMLQTARTNFEKVINQFAQSPARPVAVYERAIVIVMQGDIGGAINELNQFQNDPLKAAPVAPLAMLRQAALYRSQNRSDEAVRILTLCRQLHEGTLAADASRAAWIPLIQYHQALATQETGKLAEAKVLYDSSAKLFIDKLEGADCAWRAGQVRRLEALAKFSEAKKKLAQPGLPPAETAAGNTLLQEAIKLLTETGVYFDQQLPVVAQKHKGAGPHLQLLYEAAWTQRVLAQEEIERARKQLQAEAVQKLQQAAAPPAEGKPAPVIAPPDIPLTAIPQQPAEKKVIDAYQAMIAAAPEAGQSRLGQFELAEFYAQRENQDAAIAELVKLIDAEPSPELEERARLRLGTCYVAKKEFEKAASAFDAMTQSTQPTVAAEARHRAAEMLMLGEKWDAAVKQLLPLRDAEPLKNLPGHSDRGLLRLGYAYGQLKQWDPARQSFEQVLQRFPQSTWADDARYGMAWAWQNQNQFDQAVNTYRQLTQTTGTELSARSQLQIGLCRAAQKRMPEAVSELLVVPFTYDYPEINAQALCEAAKALVEMNQREQGVRLFKKVIADYATTAWAASAREQLAKLQ